MTPRRKKEVEYKVTGKELDELVVKTTIEDCKVDACLDRFSMRAHNIQEKDKHKPKCGRYAWPQTKTYPWLNENGSFVKGDFTRLKHDLVTDLETLIPDYFQRNYPDAVTVDAKFESIHDKLKERHGEKQLYRYDDGEFHETMVGTLAETRYRQLTDRLNSSTESDPEPGATSLQETCSAQLLKELSSAVEGEEDSSLFTCGGTIAIIKTKATPKVPKEPPLVLHESTPIILFWLSEKSSSPQRTTLPPQVNGTVPDSGTLKQLVNGCTPATFGRGDQDVLDPTYRCAGQLDPDRFSTNFHPADFGILDSIEQTLLPSISTSQDNELQRRRVRAELYKLNVYSGPSGIFRAHVDTPRSSSQFGSLVVCLPSPHQGGSLLVRHKGSTVTFDWAKEAASNIQWAAFYSDCEHEINKVTKGHRMTLTYNLFITEPVGSALLPNPVVQPNSFKLYDQVKNLLSQRTFFTNGGVLGLHCAHSYPHSSDLANIALPLALKGSDMALFAVLKDLGFETKVLPILEQERFDEGEESMYEQQLNDYRRDGYMKKPFWQYRKDDENEIPFTLNYDDSFPNSLGCDDIHQRWKVLLATRHALGTGIPPGRAEVGKKLYPHITSDWGGDDSEDIRTLTREDWPNDFLSGITWLSKPRHRKPAITHMVYGNNAEIHTRYSSAAIFAVIPSWVERTAD